MKKGTSGARTDEQALAFLAHMKRCFPKHTIPYFRDFRPNQVPAMEVMARYPHAVIEMPTGDGKTAIQYAYLKALSDIGQPAFWLFPNKAILRQTAEAFPDITPVYGRGDFPCWFYEEDKSKLPAAGEAESSAADVPCGLLHTCPHRVDQTTGEPHEEGAALCPYLRQKYEAKKKKGGIVACTFAFYFYSVFLAHEWPNPPAVVVFDEVDQLPGTLRKLMSVEISDLRLGQVVELLEQAGIEKIAFQFRRFRAAMIRTVRTRCRQGTSLFTDEETQKLLDILEGIDERQLRREVSDAIKRKAFDPKTQKGALKTLDSLTHSLKRYVNAIRYSLPEKNRPSLLNYVYGSWEREVPKDGESSRRVRFRMHIRCYAVGPIIRRLCPPSAVGFSATIGKPEIFEVESGMRQPDFHYAEFASDFPAGHASIIIPSDAADLSQKGRRKGQPTREIRRVAKRIQWFTRRGVRSLFLVVSNAEKDIATVECDKLGLKIVTYGGSITAREAAEMFKKGDGDVLIGTCANYAYGLDLPRKICPVTFLLRPDWPSPNSPESQFEEKRFGMGCWGVRHNRVVRTSLQGRGRNLRSKNDRGVTIYVSAQFRKFLRSCLPLWLKDAYLDDLPLAESCEHALKVIRGEPTGRKPKAPPPGFVPAASVKDAVRPLAKALPRRSTPGFVRHQVKV